MTAASEPVALRPGPSDAGELREMTRLETVSYTHLDVYKRQIMGIAEGDITYALDAEGTLAGLMGGVVITETVFDYPGICLLYTSRCV